MDDIKSSRSKGNGYNKKKSFFPFIKVIPNVDIVKKKSKKIKHASSSPLKYDSDTLKDENSRVKKRDDDNNNNKNSVRNSQPKNLNIEPLTNLNQSKQYFIKTLVRFRPNIFIENEMNEKGVGLNCTSILNYSTVCVQINDDSFKYTFDNVFNSQASQEDLFNSIGVSMLSDYIKGFNVSLITYGHKSAGKSYTVLGDDFKENRGFLPRAVDYIFEYINNEGQNEFELMFSVVEINDENVYDYLCETNTNIKIKENKKKGVYFENLKEIHIGSKEEIYLFLDQIYEKKSLSLNKSNSHFIYSIKLLQKYPDESTIKSLLNIFDLAGGEKVIDGEEQKENFSLSNFSHVIECLCKNQNDYIPYNESKLTKILKDSLGGNVKTYLLICSSMHSLNVDEIISSFNLSKKANKIKNTVKMNIRKNPDDLEDIIISLNNKLKVANAEIKRLNSLNSNKKFDCFSPVKSRYTEILPFSVTPSLNKVSVTNSPIKLSKNPISLMTEGNKGLKSKSSLFDFNNLDPSLKEDILFSSNMDDKESHGVSSYLVNDITIVKNNNFSDKWKENMENLINENKILKDKLTKIEEVMNVVQLVERIEDSLKLSLKGLEDYSKFYKENIVQLRFQENYKLKEILAAHENRVWEKLLQNFQIEECKFSNTDDKEGKGLYKKFLEKLDKDDNNFKSYKAIYENIKFFSKKLLVDFLKINFIEKEDKEGKEMIRIEKSHYEHLKKSFIKSNSLVIFYEKLLKDLLDKFALDISNFKLYENQFKFLENIIHTFNTNLANYINIFNDLKTYVYYREEQSNREFNSQINEGKTRSKLIINNLKSSAKSLDGFSSILKKLSSNNFYFRDTENNDFEKEKADFFELRMLRNESLLTKYHLSCLINEISHLRQSNIHFDNNLLDLQQSLYNNFKNDMDNVEKEIQTYKHIYNQEVEDLKRIIEELTINYDDMLLNLNSEGNGKEALKKILNKEEKNKSINNLAGTLLAEGVASKRLDYVFIDMNKNQNMNIVFGSGLNKRVPSKSPLYKNLKYSPKGDNCTDVYTPENTDY